MNVPRRVLRRRDELSACIGARFGPAGFRQTEHLHTRTIEAGDVRVANIGCVQFESGVRTCNSEAAFVLKQSLMLMK